MIAGDEKKYKKIKKKLEIRKKAVPLQKKQQKSKHYGKRNSPLRGSTLNKFSRYLDDWRISALAHI